MRRCGSWDPHALVFLDESGAKTDMTRLRGRSPRGERVCDHTPAGHWGTTTMISSIRVDGTTACMTVDGATDTDVLAAYIEFVLRPTLRPGDLVVLDNLSPHKGAIALRLIEQAGATACFLPPCSPDFNPIEGMWSKVKTFPQTEKARAEEALGAAIARALSRVTASDARNWFASCGYSFI
ncbi:MAG: IS630 family transposase [Verrucomicrobiota bacterium]|nr:IS630 family transposase [Verrucomicrobiota bacterium]